MHSSTIFLALGFTLAATTSAAPLSQLTPTMGPLFTVVSRVPASTATEVADVTASGLPKHKHTPKCEPNSSAKHNPTTQDAHNSTTEAESDASGAKDHAVKAMGNTSSCLVFNASAYAYPHSVPSHNHTGEYCDHPSHHNTTATSATYDKIIHPRILNASALSSHNQTGYRSTHASYDKDTSANYGHKCADKKPMVASLDETHNHNGTTRAGQSDGKKLVIPRVDVTVCLGADCTDSKVVTADINSAGELTGVDTKDGKRAVKRQDTETTYEDIVRQMSGARIAGSM